MKPTTIIRHLLAVLRRTDNCSFTSAAEDRAIYAALLIVQDTGFPVSAQRIAGWEKRKMLREFVALANGCGAALPLAVMAGVEVGK